MPGPRSYAVFSKTITQSANVGKSEGCQAPVGSGVTWPTS